MKGRRKGVHTRSIQIHRRHGGRGRGRELNEKTKPTVKLAARGPLHNPLIGGTNDAHYWPRCAHQIIVAAVAAAASAAAAAAKRRIRITKRRGRQRGLRVANLIH